MSPLILTVLHRDDDEGVLQSLSRIVGIKGEHPKFQGTT